MTAPYEAGRNVRETENRNQAASRPLSPDDIIIVSCMLCNRVLYRGTVRDARHLILYCDKCPA